MVFRILILAINTTEFPFCVTLCSIHNRCEAILTGLSPRSTLNFLGNMANEVMLARGNICLCYARVYHSRWGQSHLASKVFIKESGLHAPITTFNYEFSRTYIIKIDRFVFCGSIKKGF